MIDYQQYRDELEPSQHEELDAVHDYGFDRYVKYRRQGHDIDHAYRYALAWGRNVRDQAKRRKGHDTGCE